MIDEVENFAIMNDCETLSLEVRLSNTDVSVYIGDWDFLHGILEKIITLRITRMLDMIKRLEVG